MILFKRLLSIAISLGILHSTTDIFSNLLAYEINFMEIPYSNPDDEKFNVEEFKTYLDNSKAELINSGDFKQAKNVIDKSNQSINEMKTNLYLLQHKYFIDNNDIVTLCQFNDLSSQIYEAEKYLYSFITDISEWESFTEIKNMYTSHVFDDDFLQTQTNLINDYYSNKEFNKLSEIYIQLINLRKNSADSDNYADTVLKRIYKNDYSINDLIKIKEQIKDLLLYISKYDIDYYSLYESIETTSGEALNEFEKSLSDTSEEYHAIYTSATKNNLFRTIDESECTSIGAITSYLYKYNESLSTIIYSSKKSDKLNVIDEFGKYINRYYKAENYESKNETELLICNMFQILLNDDKLLYITKLTNDLQQAYIVTSFEIYAYTEDNISPEKLSKKYYEIKKEIGYSYPDLQNTDDSWVCIEDIFTLPLSSSISISSILNSLQYWNITDKSQSLAILNNFLKASPSSKTIELLKENNMKSCFDSDNLSASIESFKSIIDNSFSETGINKKGDVNIDGIINASDILTLKKYLLKHNDFSDFSHKNADINSDDSINIFDLKRLKDMIM